jgi:transcriptional regulator with XRE-family HTH domain
MEQRPTFGYWLDEQLRVRGWLQVDLVRQTGASTSAVSRWVRDKERPKPHWCEKIADAFGQPRPLVLQRAGHLVAEANAQMPLDEAELRRRIDDLLGLMRQQLARTSGVYGAPGMVAAMLGDRRLALIDRDADAREGLIAWLDRSGRPGMGTSLPAGAQALGRVVLVYSAYSGAIEGLARPDDDGGEQSH